MLKLRRKEGSPNWYIRGTLKGTYVEESTGTRNKDIAEHVRVKREAEILEQAVFGFAKTSTFADACLSYMEQGGEKRFLPALLEHFETMRLEDIGQQEIDDAGKSIYPSAGPGTLLRQLYTPMKAVLRHAAHKGWCKQPMLKAPKQPKGRVRWLTPAEAESLIEACEPHLKPLTVFLFGTGARIGEAMHLEWRHINLEKKRVMFINTKNGESRGVPLHNRVLRTLYRLDQNGTKVFKNRKGRNYTMKHSNGSQIQTAFKGACKRAGIEDFTPHDCRHTWATWLYAETRDIGELMQLGGWKTASMVMRYAHTNPDHLADSIAKLPWRT